MLPGDKGPTPGDATGQEASDLSPHLCLQSPSGIPSWQEPDDEGQVGCAEFQPQRHRAGRRVLGWSEGRQPNEQHVPTICSSTDTHSPVRT